MNTPTTESMPEPKNGGLYPAPMVRAIGWLMAEEQVLMERMWTDGVSHYALAMTRYLISHAFLFLGDSHLAGRWYEQYKATMALINTNPRGRPTLEDLRQ